MGLDAFSQVSNKLVDDGRLSAGDRLVDFFPPAVFPPMEVHTDPAFAYALLGSVVEERTGLALWQYCAHNIFAPLKMTTTSFSGPGFLNPGPDPDGLAKEEREIAQKQLEKMQQRAEQMRIDQARAKAIKKADEAKRFNDKMAQKNRLRHGGGEGYDKGTIFGEMVESKKRVEEVRNAEARNRQWETDQAWEKQMNAERARQRADEREAAALAVRHGEGLPMPEGWPTDDPDAPWPPLMWRGFRAWPGFRITAWSQGIPRPADESHHQLVLKRSPRAPIPALAPAMSLLTTGRDMGRLMLCLLSEGAYKGKKVVQAPTMRAAHAQFTSAHPAIAGVTLSGFAEFRDGVNRALVCDSADPATGSSSSMLLLLEHGVGLFVSFNCCSGHGMHRIQPTLSERFLDHFFPVPPSHVDHDQTPPASVPPPPIEFAKNGPKMLELANKAPVLAIEPPLSAEADAARTAAELFGTHKLDLLAALVPFDPDGDGAITAAELSQGLKALMPMIPASVLHYLIKTFAKPPEDEEEEGKDAAAAAARQRRVAADEEADLGGGSSSSEEGENEGALLVDYRAIAAKYGASWVSNALRAEEEVAAFARANAKRGRRRGPGGLVGKWKGFRADPYLGQYAATRAPRHGIDRLRFYETVLCVESSDIGHLRVRRLEEGGPTFREMHSATTDMELCALYPQRHVFMRGERKVLAAFGTDFEGRMTHLFLNPSAFASYRRLHWYEYKRVQLALAAGFSFIFSVIVLGWAAFATPTLPFFLCLFSTACREHPHDNTLEELGSWFMILSLLANLTFIGLLKPVLLRKLHSGAIEEWYRDETGPPSSVKYGLLAIPPASMLLTKGLFCMVLWLYIKDEGNDPRSHDDDHVMMRDSWLMWSAFERLVAALVVPLNCAFYCWLDWWQLIGHRW